MGQRTLSVTLEVNPHSYGELCALVDAVHDGGGSGAGEFALFMRHAPSVHFLSMSVFPAADYDPLFVMEANFDGDPASFWHQLETVIGAELRAMVRCCKRPLDDDGPRYDAVAAAGSQEPATRYFAARALRPSVFHHGNRGLSRERIVAERALFRAIGETLSTAGASPDRAEASGIHQQLRAALLPTFPWLADPPPPRITTGERAADLLRLIGFVAAVVVLLALPGTLIAAITPTARFLLLLAAALALILGPLIVMRHALPGTATPGSGFPIPAPLRTAGVIAAAAAAGFVIVAPVATLVGALLTGRSLAAAWSDAPRATLLGLLSVAVVVLPGIVLWLRWLERRDSSHDAPPIDEDAMRQMAQREDWIPQNHMASIVLLKPGMLRTIIVHAGHRALGLVLRWTATSGYLGSMRTVHFAHWAFANNGSRLMFFSNFDQSWESYLDDFIEKAHVGLTLAWGCGVGFPPTRFLVLDGASHGRRFKAWARHSMTISRFWYSAYPDLTVDQIERNWRIATGLRRRTLSDKEAAAWIADL